MDVLKLTGGTLIGVKPDRTEMPIYGDKARMRVGSPGTIIANVAMGAQFGICTRTELKVPETGYAKVVFRQVGEKLYLLMAPANAPGLDVYGLKYEGRRRAPVIRLLKPLFEEMKITLRPDIWYDMESKIVQDETLGMAVAGVWTDAEMNQRGSEKDVAAGDQPDVEVDEEPDQEAT